MSTKKAAPRRAGKNTPARAATRNTDSAPARAPSRSSDEPAVRRAAKTNETADAMPFNAGKRAEYVKQREEVKENIQGRAAELDNKWKHISITTRAEALKDYLTKTPNCPPEVKTEIEAAIKLTETSQARIEKVLSDVKTLRKNPETGKNGTPEERAAAVKQYLVARFGIDAARLTSAGYGDAKPAAPNTTPEGRQQNRRVELVRN